MRETRAVHEKAPSFPLGDFLGMEVTDHGGGRATAMIDAGSSHHNPHGFLHGAALFAMADTSMGAAVMGLLEDGKRCSTIELQLRFLRPVVSGRLEAESVVLRAGRRIAHLESRVSDDRGRLVAVATGSFAIVDEAPGDGT